MEGVIKTLAECSGALGGYLSAFPSSHLDRYERIEPVRLPTPVDTKAEGQGRRDACWQDWREAAACSRYAVHHRYR